MADDWRTIPCREIDWHCLPQISKRVAGDLDRQCREATAYIKERYPKEAERRWHEMTLGELADRGERWWRRFGHGIGKVGVEAIKVMIDHAAAGYEVRKNLNATNAYFPREVPPPSPEQARKPR